jgi:hypothetical protein
MQRRKKHQPSIHTTSTIYINKLNMALKGILKFTTNCGLSNTTCVHSYPTILYLFSTIRIKNITYGRCNRCRCTIRLGCGSLSPAPRPLRETPRRPYPNGTRPATTLHYGWCSFFPRCLGGYKYNKHY